LNFRQLNSTKGAIGILTTLILTIALVAMAIGIALNGMSSRANALSLNQSEKVFIPVEGCSEEALIRLSRNHDYAGGSYSIGDVECTVAISGSDDTRDIVISGEKNNITRDLFIRAQINPSFGIMEWSD